ncbi:MAG: nucleotidyltransferase domain-containing protein [Bacteroidales bacterium]|nr:nucleotidyltransferase domain-containing protein [Bacteroidales bacterium]
MALIQDVFRRHPEVSSATLFGSRAKGTHSDRSDVDLVVTGAVDPLRAEAISAELDELLAAEMNRTGASVSGTHKNFNIIYKIGIRHWVS